MLRRIRSWNGWDIVSVDSMYEWSAHTMIIDENGDMDADHMVTKDDQCQFMVIPRYCRTGLDRLESQLVQAKALERLHRRAQVQALGQDVGLRVAHGARKNSSSGGTSSSIGLKKKKKKKKDKLGLIFKALKVPVSNSLLIRSPRLMTLDDSDNDSDDDDDEEEEEDIDRDVARIGLEAKGEISHLYFGTGVVLVTYDRIESAKAVFQLLNGQGCIYCPPAIVFKNEEQSSFPFHANKLSVPLSENIVKSLGITTADVTSIELDEKNGRATVNFQSLKCCMNTAFNHCTDGISYIPLNPNEQRLRQSLIEFVDCSQTDLVVQPPRIIVPNLSTSATPTVAPPTTTTSAQLSQAWGIKSLMEAPTTTKLPPAQPKMNSNFLPAAPPHHHHHQQQQATSNGDSKNSSSSNNNNNRSGGNNKNAEFKVDIPKIRAGMDTRTSIMIRNIPNKYTQKMVLEELDELFHGTYDFFYLPIDFKNKCNIGYAFINFIDPLTIIPFYETLHNRKWSHFNSDKICAIAFARIQGREALLGRFKNSNVMSKEEECRPVILNPPSVAPNFAQRQ